MARLAGVYVMVRAALLVADVLSAHLAYNGTLSGPLLSWDSHWYLYLAAHFYPAAAPMAGGRLTYGPGGFEPVSPALVRALGWLDLSGVGAGLVVSVVSGAVAMPLALAALVPTLGALRRRDVPRALVSVLAVPAGFVAFAVALGFRYHYPLFWWHLQHQAWGASIDFGRSLLCLLAHPGRMGLQGPGWLEWIGVVAVLGAVVALAPAKTPALINVYCIGVFVMLFVSTPLGFKPRLLTWAFPALIEVAVVTRERAHQALTIAFACALPLLFVVYTTLGNSIAQP